MRRRDIESCRKHLLTRRAGILKLQENQLTEESLLIEGREPDWIDLATDHREAGLLDLLSEHEQQEIVEIHAALQRIANGTYGVCERCGGKIPSARMRAVPEARQCVECSALGEQPQRASA